jgi:hypothetical protein
MTMFYFRFCDRTRQMIDVDSIEADDIHDALAGANRHVRRIVENPDFRRIDPLGCIDFEDRQGRTLARVMLDESIAACR